MTIIFRQQFLAGVLTNSYNGKDYNLHGDVELRHEDWGIELSVTGVYGAFANGNAYGDCGQNIDDFRELAKQEESRISEIFTEALGYSITREEWDDEENIVPMGLDQWENACMKIYELDELETLIAIWDTWHLNGMNSGTKKQQQAIDEWKKTDYYSENVNGLNHYDEVCNYLKSIGLYVDKSAGNYKYGHAWLREALPLSVIQWVKNYSLRNAQRQPGEWGETPIN